MSGSGLTLVIMMLLTWKRYPAREISIFEIKRGIYMDRKKERLHKNPLTCLKPCKRGRTDPPGATREEPQQKGNSATRESYRVPAN